MSLAPTKKITPSWPTIILFRQHLPSELLALIPHTTQQCSHRELMQGIDATRLAPTAPSLSSWQTSCLGPTAVPPPSDPPQPSLLRWMVVITSPRPSRTLALRWMVGTLPPLTGTPTRTTPRPWMFLLIALTVLPVVVDFPPSPKLIVKVMRPLSIMLLCALY